MKNINDGIAIVFGLGFIKYKSINGTRLVSAHNPVISENPNVAIFFNEKKYVWVLKGFYSVVVFCLHMAVEITITELEKKMASKEQFILLDVRTSDERSIATINGVVWIPMDEIEQRYVELDTKKEIIVYCHHGMRSEKVAAFLRTKGFNAKSLKGGIDAWSEEVDGSVQRY